MEETMWDVFISLDAPHRHIERLRAILASAIRERLPRNKELLRVVAWSPEAGGLFEPRAGVCRYAVSYEVRATA
ncbi:MAG: hypothetical protein JWR11_767 [Mycobacterium sp.]|nr:hypothetical protein [Mycobacterium sp.]MDT5177496.1 hypothetical protein [Mycobacterium sp.]